MIDKLQTLIDAGRVPHALVIDGGTYDDRLLCAKELAAQIIGDKTKVMSDISPDVITVLPEEKKKTLSVEIIRKMRDDAYIIPNENERKVYIIAKAELMQDYAQNALLKILEEPPSYATFILLCSTHSSLLSTIISRVAIFTLKDDGIDKNSESFEESLQGAKVLALAIASKDQFKILEALSAYEKNFDEVSLVLDCLKPIVRDALVLSAGGDVLIGGADSEARALAALPQAQLLKVQEGIDEIVKAISIYGNKNLTLTRLVYKLSGGQND